MAGRAATLGAEGFRVLVIGPGTAEGAARLAERLGVDVAADPTGRALDALGCTAVFGPFRRSGTIVIGADGRIQRALVTTNPNAAMPWAEVQAALDAARPHLER